MLKSLLRGALALAVLVPVPTVWAAPQPQESPREIIEKVKDKKDRSPGAWFETLGEGRDSASLRALEQALGIVKSEAKLSEVARAFRHFAGDSRLESSALRRLRALALEGKPAEARAGVAGLAATGEPGNAVLEEVLLQIDDGVARARALKPLVPGLGARGDRSSLALILAAWRTPDSGDDDAGLTLLRKFQAVEHLEQMGKAVSDEDVYGPRRQLVLRAVAGMLLEGDALIEADEVIDRGLATKDAAVQFRALEAVATRGRALRRQSIDALTRSEADELRRLAHVALARLDLAESGGDPKSVIALGRAKDPAARQAAALELARLGTDEALETLLTLLADADARVRSEAIKAIAARRRASSIVALIDRLDAEKGKHRLEVYWALRMLTGEDHGSRDARWRAWWRGEGKTFEVPTLAQAQEAERGRETRRDQNTSKVSFYGLEVVSNRVAFVIDTSGSMNAKAYEGKTRLEIAKGELRRVVENMQGDEQFNIISFSTGVHDWQKSIVLADPKNRSGASTYVEGLKANGGTSIYDALERAFSDKHIDTIYFLSDGDPSSGAITDPALIRAEVARWNSARHVTVHCIAIGQDHALLRGLASDSGGRYLRID